MPKSFALSLTLFFASAFAGALISYTPSTAWPRFALIVIGLVFYIILLMLPEKFRLRSWGRISLLRFILAILPTVVIVYFILTNDWTSRLGKMPWLDPILRTMIAWQLMLPGIRLNSNSFGGVVAALVPLQLAALVENNRRLTWVGLILVSISAGGLLVSESCGAWLAVVGVAGLWALWKLSGLGARQWAGNRPRHMQIAISVGVLVLVSLAGTLAAATPLGQSLLQRRSDRLTVWRNSLDLASDYPLTGLGLGGFAMAYSSYVLLLHVAYLIHAHNLYLDVWLEQGLAGLGAFAALVMVSVLSIIGSFLRGGKISRWQVAACASLGIVLLHGVVDDPFYGYGGIAIPFLFVPLGLLARRDRLEEIHLLGLPRFRIIPIVAGAVIVLLAVTALLPGIRSVFVSNMGALSQTRAELSVYSWPVWPIQDELRRSDKVDLAPAIALYKTSLAIDPQNATANRRLGQIELSRGEYDLARQHLEAAYAVAPNQRATRQLLGELYAISGNIDQAIALWKGIDMSNGQLETRQWWYEHIGEREHAAWIKLATE